MKKNIIFLSFLNIWSMDKNKGAQSFYKTIAGYLNDGWNVTLINPDYNVGTTPDIKKLKTIRYKPIFFPLCKIKYVSFFGRILHALHGEHKLIKLAEKALFSYDFNAVIYAYEVNGVNPGKKLVDKYKLPFITRFQGTILAPIKDTWFNRLRHYPHFQALGTSADITIMTNDGTKGKEVLKRLNNNSKHIYFWRNGVDFTQYTNSDKKEKQDLRKRYKLTSGDRILITVSRLASWKKVDRAIYALSEVLKERSDCKLVIVGDGDEKENLISLADELNVSSNVIFTGAIPQKEVWDHLNIADIFMSLYNLSNCGNPLFEAMSCGKPIITLDVGDTSSVIMNGQNGILLNIDELNKIPKYINKILNDNESAEYLGNNAKEYAKKNFWTWDERIQTEINVVENLLDKAEE